jgi:hypothetical protein
MRVGTWHALDRRGDAHNDDDDDVGNPSPAVISKTKLRGLSPRVNYTDRATEACRRT